MDPRVLVVYYTRTGSTKRVAESIAEAFDADVEEIVDRTKRAGVLGYLRSGFEAAFHRQIPIGPAVRDPTKYDLVIVGTPIWDLSVSSPVRSYLNRHRGKLARVAFFCTSGGRGGERAFAQMEDLCGAKPISTLVISDVERSAHPIARFAAEIDQVLIGAAQPVARVPSPAPPVGPAATKP